MGKDGKKGLGMGLGALFGEEYPAPQPERAEKASVLSSITFYSNVNLGPMSGTFFFL